MSLPSTNNVENKHLVSIIMPVYNAEKFIREALDSVLQQTYDNWELLIYNDFSSDKSENIIKEYINDTRVKYFYGNKNIGAFKAKNYLINKAHGDFITFLDADDLMNTKRIELQLDRMTNDEKLGMVGCQVLYVNEKKEILRKSKKPITYDEIKFAINSNNVIGGSIMFIRRAALEKVGGGFRSYFDRLSYQDYDLSMLLVENYKCENLKEFLYTYRQHVKSISKSISEDRLIAKDLMIHLRKQRQKFGEDELMRREYKELNKTLNILRKPYKDSKSLKYQLYAENFMYNKFYLKAIETSFKGLTIDPWKFKNWRTLQYCLRITLLKKLGLAT